MKAVVATFNQEKVLLGAFSVITNLQMELFEALIRTVLGIMTLLCEETKQFTSFSFQTLAVISPLLATRHPPAAACCMNESERIHIL